MVFRKQALSGEHDTIDLHGTTVNDAMAIVLELLETRGRGKPLKVVTGKGIHSANGTGVLKPALKKRLVEEGWNVGAWDAGLIVR
jgi:DNA-nicking Smr family endonuclease